jgi:hypothetical protein
VTLCRVGSELHLRTTDDSDDERGSRVVSEPAAATPTEGSIVSSDATLGFDDDLKRAPFERGDALLFAFESVMVIPDDNIEECFLFGVLISVGEATASVVTQLPHVLPMVVLCV